MIRRMFCLFYLLTFLVSINYAQDAIRVESFTIEGELTSDDPISEGLGRINAVQLNFTAGDHFHSSLSADFIPMLVLTAPSGEYKISYPDEETFSAEYDGIISETGQWLLYIVGDSTDTGSYTLENKYASAESMNFDFEGDYCKNIDIILTHAKADFYFIKGEARENNSVVFDSKVDFPGLENCSIYGLGNEWFKGLVFSGLEKSFADNVFTSTESSLSDCLSNDWKRVTKDWEKVIGGNNIKQKSILFYSKNGDGLFLKLVETENFNSELENDDPYTVEIIINKER